MRGVLEREAESFSKAHKAFLHDKVGVGDSGSQADSQHQFGSQTSPQRLRGSCHGKAEVWNLPRAAGGYLLHHGPPQVSGVQLPLHGHPHGLQVISVLALGAPPPLPLH